MSERFCYWRGASGRRYIHSVYRPDECPPLPGAIYLAARREGADRKVLVAGRFPAVLDLKAAYVIAARLAALGAEELHVHLLAGGDAAAEAILDDLAAALGATPQPVGLAA